MRYRMQFRSTSRDAGLNLYCDGAGCYCLGQNNEGKGHIMNIALKASAGTNLNDFISLQTVAHIDYLYRSAM